MSTTGQEPIKKAAAPWMCTGQVYGIFFYTKRGNREVADNLPAVAFSPLERESYFASAEAGRFCGGLGGFMIIRYKNTPVGPYDELLFIPGAYSYQVEERGKLVEKQNPRITRIFVSQRHTLFNGRYSKFQPWSTASDHQVVGDVTSPWFAFLHVTWGQAEDGLI